MSRFDIEIDYVGKPELWFTDDTGTAYEQLPTASSDWKQIITDFCYQLDAYRDWMIDEKDLNGLTPGGPAITVDFQYISEDGDLPYQDTCATFRIVPMEAADV